jgi:two-component system CheB/CheR fusion protein
VRLYGWTEAEALQLNARDRIPPELRDEALAALVRLSRAEVLEPYDSQRLTKNGKTVKVTLVATALVDEAGQIYGIATTERPKLA